MKRTGLIWIFAILPAVAVIVWAGPLGRAEAWGAHPYWGGKVALYGVVPGLILWRLLRRRGPRRVVLLLLLLGSVLAAHYGKAAFARSLGENVLAGKFWFYGWIAFCAALTASWAALNEAILRRS